jgi:hypothetical protein
MPTSARRPRPSRIGATAALAAVVAMGLGACSADDAESAPPSTSAVSAPTDTSTPRPASSEPASDDADSKPSSMTCKQFRALDDAARKKAVTELGATSNAGRVATVAATVCLSRPEDKLSDVVDELLGR